MFFGILQAIFILINLFEFGLKVISAQIKVFTVKLYFSSIIL